MFVTLTTNTFLADLADQDVVGVGGLDPEHGGGECQPVHSLLHLDSSVQEDNI